jgi:hypothetical protein
MRLACVAVLEPNPTPEEYTYEEARYISLLPVPDIVYSCLRLRRSEMLKGALISQHSGDVDADIYLHVDRAMNVPVVVLHLTDSRDVTLSVQHDLEQLSPDPDWVSDVSFIFSPFIFQRISWAYRRTKEYLSDSFWISADAVTWFVRKYRKHFQTARFVYDVQHDLFDLEFSSRSGMTVCVSLAHTMKQVPDAHLYINKPLLDLNAENATPVERTMASTGKSIKFIPINREVIERLATRYSFRVCERCAAALEMPDNWLHLAFYSPNGHIYPARITSTITSSDTIYFIDPTRANRTVCGIEQGITGVTSILVVASHQMVLDAYYHQKKGHPLLKVLGQNRDVLGEDLTFSLIPEDSMLNAMTLAALMDTDQG